MKVSVVIPAYNERERIESVLEAVSNSKRADEIIVVNDGSDDGTLDEINKWKEEVKLLNLQNNTGKANALDRGVEMAKHSTLLFLDADLVGLKPSHVDRLIGAYEEKDCDMVIGIFHKGRFHTDVSQKFFSSHLSGQRVLSEKVWDELNLNKAEKFGVEMALSKMNLDVEKIKLEGLTHVMKEEKRGFFEGVKARLEMYYHIVKTFFTR